MIKCCNFEISVIVKIQLNYGIKLCCYLYNCYWRNTTKNARAFVDYIEQV